MTSTLDIPTLTSLDTHEENEDDPSLSSASLCIQFEMLGTIFRPVFTHQVFPGEYIPGWQPPQQTVLECYSSAMMANNDNNDNREEAKNSKDKKQLHSSHRHHTAYDTNNKELSILVRLAPSLQSCHVELLDSNKGSQIITLPQPASKRRRVDDSDNSGDDQDSNNDTAMKSARTPGDNSTSNTLSINWSEGQEEKRSDSHHGQYNGEHEKKEDWEEYEDSQKNKRNDSDFEVVEGEVNDIEVDIEEEEQKQGTIESTRMPIKDILQGMERGLPPIVGPTKSVNDAFLERPLGVELKEYSVKDKSFVLCLANGSEESANYHNQVQRLAVWFIETADDVDIASTEGGYWKVLYLFQKHNQTTQQFSLAGYLTLFHFHAPFKKPKPGIVVRICQALILPPHQRSGHGKQMMTCVMDIAHGRYSDQLLGGGASPKQTKKDPDDDDEIVEINVESPAPAFVMLRNRTDLEGFLRSMEDNDPWIPLENSTSVLDADFFTGVSEAQIIQAAAKAKIFPRQVQIMMELYKLYQLHEYLRSHNDRSKKDELEKRFRLMVKKRLNKEHRDVLSGLRTKAEKQAFLEDEYQKCASSYLATLPKVTSPP
jgi:hypothetical protein